VSRYALHEDLREPRRPASSDTSKSPRAWRSSSRFRVRGRSSRPARRA